MNGKPRDMDYKFAIKVLNSAKVVTPSMHGNPYHYGYQNQTFYDIARQMAIQALKEKYEKTDTATDVVPRAQVLNDLSKLEIFGRTHFDGHFEIHKSHLEKLKEKYKD